MVNVATKKPNDYVIGINGMQYSVSDFAKLAFSHVGLDYKKYLKINKNLLRPAEVTTLLADYSQATKIKVETKKYRLKS